MAMTNISPTTEGSHPTTLCINDALRDDELRMILSKMESEKEREVFGLVCNRWLHLQSTDRKKLCARAGPHMLRKMASRFSRLAELDLSQSVSDPSILTLQTQISLLSPMDSPACAFSTCTIAKIKRSFLSYFNCCAKPEEEIGAHEPGILGLFM